jgi:hypothetical protein
VTGYITLKHPEFEIQHSFVRNFMCHFIEYFVSVWHQGKSVVRQISSDRKVVERGIELLDLRGRNETPDYGQRVFGLIQHKAAYCIAFWLLSGAAFGQTWTGILAPARGADWSLAGSAHIWDTRTQCNSAACQVMCSDFPTCAVAKNNTAVNINAALAAAPYNTYVQLPPTSGSDSIAGIKFPAGGSGLTTCTTNCSNITLRGSGPNSTVFILTGQSCTDSGTSAICAESSDQNIWSPAGTPSNTANWTAGYTQGGNTITLSAVTNLKVGWPIILDQLDDATDNGAFWVDCESSVLCGQDGPSGFQRTGRAQFQIVNVASCTTGSGAGDTTFGHLCTSGTGVTITPGLYAPNWRTGQTPGAWWATSPIFNDGVENMAATYNSGVGLIFFNCTGCWQRNFKGVRTTSTPTGWFHGSAFISNHVTFRDSYYYGFTGDSYVVGPQMASDLLIENNIANKPSGFVYNSDCEGCVLGYNFSVDAGANATAFLSQSHWYHSVVLYALDEGNFGAGLYADLFHGNHVMNTAFRNRWQGKGIDGTGAPTTSGNNALILAYGSRYNNFVGNVMGMPGYHTGYQTGTNVVDVDTSDTAILPSVLFWGNWNAGSNANLFCTATSTPIASCPRDERAGSATTFPGLASPSATLPASFYYSAKPAWWPTGKAWPIIGPDITGGNVGVCATGSSQFADVVTTVTNVCGAGITPATLASGEVTSNPAMDCYFNVMGGNALGTNGPLTFDPTLCVGFNGPITPTSPVTPVPALGLFADLLNF